MLPEPTLNTYLALSAVLFSIGTAGVFLRRNLITVLLSVEVMLNAVNLTFVAVDRFLGTVDGHAGVNRWAPLRLSVDVGQLHLFDPDTGAAIEAIEAIESDADAGRGTPECSQVS